MLEREREGKLQAVACKCMIRKGKSHDGGVKIKRIMQSEKLKLRRDTYMKDWIAFNLIYCLQCLFRINYQKKRDCYNRMNSRKDWIVPSTPVSLIGSFLCKACTILPWSTYTREKTIKALISSFLSFFIYSVFHSYMYILYIIL